MFFFSRKPKPKRIEPWHTKTDYTGRYITNEDALICNMNHQVVLFATFDDGHERCGFLSPDGSISFGLHRKPFCWSDCVVCNAEAYKKYKENLKKHDISLD